MINEWTPNPGEIGAEDDMGEDGYNGWKNYETWNVALWISNTEVWYLDAVRYAKDERINASYSGFVKEEMDCGMMQNKTGDGVWWLDPALDYPRLNEFIQELAGDMEAEE